VRLCSPGRLKQGLGRRSLIVVGSFVLHRPLKLSALSVDVQNARAIAETKAFSYCAAPS
jgi:hypothetical protein